MKFYFLPIIFLVGAHSFAMERSRSGNEKLEIQVLFEKLETKKFEELKKTSLKLSSYQNHVINDYGNNFPMEILTQYEQELQSGLAENQIALLDVLDKYLEGNHNEFSMTDPNYKNETFYGLLDRVKVKGPHIQSYKMPSIRENDFVDSRIVFEPNEFDELKMKLKEKAIVQPEDIKTKRTQSKRGLSQWLKQKQEVEFKQEEQFGVDFRKANQRRSLSDTNINAEKKTTAEPQLSEWYKEQQPVIVDSRVINWFTKIRNHIFVIDDKMSKILQTYFLEDEFEKIEKSLSEKAASEKAALEKE